MKKKPFIFRRRKPMSLMEMSFNCLGIKRSKKRGKHLKHAMLILGYGGGLKQAMKLTGLSKRRLKGIKESIYTPMFNSRGHGKSFLTGYKVRHNNPIHHIPAPFPKTMINREKFQVFHDEMIHHDFSKIEERVMAHVVHEREKHILEAMGVASAQLGMGKPQSAIQIMAEMEKSGRTIRVLKNRVHDNLTDVVNMGYRHVYLPIIDKDLISRAGAYHSCV
ncbi:hypothetical protein COPG_00025 [Colwellia phage 9A]|uniref:Uncharacterized protein n=1 Tax=Colwellia phage 9A TaxID=765765 RepID=I3UMA6_9CAUD|nr:hypothetical protein COPG_00025 [Colwellia phage 9A]AFK66621.1 hypothetical protein COPG_00025 [Colwellia phage 9A]